MKITLLPLFKGPHVVYFSIFVGLAFLLLIMSVSRYKENSQREIDVSNIKHDSAAVLSEEELKVILGINSSLPDYNYEIIAQKNLFSPDREEWVPSSPSEEKQPEVQARPVQIDRKAFRLYGITSSSKEYQALVYCDFLEGSNKHRLLYEGESVLDDKSGQEVFRVVSIDNESVTVKAASDIFEVSMFAHSRKTNNIASQENMNIVIGGKSDKSQIAFVSKEERASSASPGHQFLSSESKSASPSAPRELPEKDGPQESEPEGHGKNYPDSGTKDHTAGLGRKADHSSDEPAQGGLEGFLQRMRASGAAGATLDPDK